MNRLASLVVEDIEDFEDSDEDDVDDDDDCEGSDLDSEFSLYEDDEELDTDEERQDEEEKRKKLVKKQCLPRKCLPVGWVISVLAILTSGFFVILYSMDWGAEKANAWLVSYTTSFFQSVLIVDPIKVIAIAAFTALLVWRAKLNEAQNEKDDLDDNDEDKDKGNSFL